ncbi:MAG: hypothetical protein M1828_000010 [Chrysothrix sp. TS-e1954]|nr:MAG: hypothetical protein M1828_000010 [Chrysothrix sp. TS-e1954]
MREVTELIRYFRQQISDNSNDSSPDVLWLADAFQDATKSDWERRWYGIILARLTGDFESKRHSLRQASEQTRHGIGSVIGSNDGEDLKVVAGALIRLQVRQGASIHEFWPASRTPLPVEIFLQNDHTKFHQDFQKLLDDLETSSERDSGVSWVTSVVVDHVQIGDCTESILAIIDPNTMTLVAPSLKAGVEELRIIDILMHNIVSCNVSLNKVKATRRMKRDSDAAIIALQLDEDTASCYIDGILQSSSTVLINVSDVETAKELASEIKIHCRKTNTQDGKSEAKQNTTGLLVKGHKSAMQGQDHRAGIKDGGRREEVTESHKSNTRKVESHVVPSKTTRQSHRPLGARGDTSVHDKPEIEPKEKSQIISFSPKGPRNQGKVSPKPQVTSIKDVQRPIEPPQEPKTKAHKAPLRDEADVGRALVTHPSPPQERTPRARLENLVDISASSDDDSLIPFRGEAEKGRPAVTEPVKAPEIVQETLLDEGSDIASDDEGPKPETNRNVEVTNATRVSDRATQSLSKEQVTIDLSEEPDHLVEEEPRPRPSLLQGSRTIKRPPPNTQISRKPPTPKRPRKKRLYGLKTRNEDVRSSSPLSPARVANNHTHVPEPLLKAKNGPALQQSDQHVISMSELIPSRRADHDIVPDRRQTQNSSDRITTKKRTSITSQRSKRARRPSTSSESSASEDPSSHKDASSSIEQQSATSTSRTSASAPSSMSSAPGSNNEKDLDGNDKTNVFEAIKRSFDLVAQSVISTLTAERSDLQSLVASFDDSSRASLAASREQQDEIIHAAEEQLRSHANNTVGPVNHLLQCSTVEGRRNEANADWLGEMTASFERAQARQDAWEKRLNELV